MDQYYLVDAGFPFYSMLTASEAAELFESVPPERRHGSLAVGFDYWEPLENGLGQRISFPVNVSPIPAGDLPAACKRLSRYVDLPEGLAP